MAKLKTQLNDADVYDFIQSAADTEQKKKDCIELVEIMKQFTGFEPKMWGTSIIGFGSYHYKSERSRQEGDWPLVAFSPRKSAISLYIYMGLPQDPHLLKNLGKFKMGKACIYIKQLSDIKQDSMKAIMQHTITYLQKKYS